MDLSVINPRRDKSGVYKVIFRNGQGQDERDINVNIMGNYKYFNLRGCTATFSQPSSLTGGVSCKILIMTLCICPDKPTPPQSCKVTDVYHDNVVVNWTPPADDGGTELTRWGNIFMKIFQVLRRQYLSRYVVEALDRTLGGDWFQVGEAAPGDRKVGINLHMFYF